MTPEIAFLRLIVEKLRAADIDHMIVGSMSSMYHGEPRTTQDIDLVIQATRKQLREFINSLPESFYANTDAADSAWQTQGMFNVIDTESFNKVDLILLKHEQFNEREFERRQPVNLQGVDTFVASAEDVVLSKLCWMRQTGSERQWLDVKSVLRVRWTSLNRGYLERWAFRLGVTEQLERAMREVGQDLPEDPHSSDAPHQ